MTDGELLAICHERFVDDGTALLYKDGRKAGCLDHGYLRVRIRGRAYYVHRLLWLMRTGALPKRDIDHVNGDRTDNSVGNLRAVSRTANIHNYHAPGNGASGVRGVEWCRQTGKWRATLIHEGKKHSLGRYVELKDAEAARLAAEARLWSRPAPRVD